MSSSQGVGFEMTRRPIAAHDPDLLGLRVLVVGLGRSGLAAARLAAARGAVVTVNDRRPEAELGDAARQVRAWGAHVHAGGHPEALLAALPFLAVAAWIVSGRCRSLYALLKLSVAPTLSTAVVLAVPVAVFGLDAIPDAEMVWFGTWAIAGGAWLFGAWRHI